jgi:hypothetical protein
MWPFKKKTKKHLLTPDPIQTSRDLIQEGFLEEVTA